MFVKVPPRSHVLNGCDCYCSPVDSNSSLKQEVNDRRYRYVPGSKYLLMQRVHLGEKTSMRAFVRSLMQLAQLRCDCECLQIRPVESGMLTIMSSKPSEKLFA